MANKKRIADLSAALTADTRDYEEGMKRAAKVTGATEAGISKTMGKLEQVGLKLGLGLVGSGGALAMLNGEIRHVIANIEKIPGVPASTIASVQQARYAFQQTRTGIDQALAGIISFTSWSARAAGFVSGALVYGLEDAERAYWEFGRAADEAAGAQERQAAAAKKAAEETAAAARIIAHARGIEDKLISDGTAAIDANAKAREAYDRRNETQIERMNRLRAEADKTLNSIMPGQANAASVANSARAWEKLTEAAKVEKDLVGVAKEHMKVWADTFAMMEDSGMAEAMDNNRRYVEEAKDSLIYFADGVGSFFDDAIARGKDLGDVVDDLKNSIISTFIRLTAINPIMNGIFGKSKGWEALPSLFGGFFAGGGNPPVGRPSIVGENGPEVFVPRSAGTIVPNHALAGSGGGNNYYFNLPGGVSESAFQQFASVVQSALGAGVIERRALSAVYDQRRRGGAAV